MSCPENATINLTVNSPLNGTNITGPAWDPLTGFNIVITASALITNGVVLLTILCTRSLRTAFSIYLINLMSSNILMVIMQNIPDVFNHLYSAWPLGDAYCSVYIFGLYVMEAGTQAGHNLIAINRIWAVYWPHSYRTVHNPKVAVLLCLTGWVVIAALILPGFMQDAMYYRADPAVYGCTLNIEAQRTWQIMVQILVFNMGVVIMWVTYPMIWYKRRQSQKILPGLKHGTANTARRPTDGAITLPSGAATGYDNFEENSKQPDGILDRIRRERKVARSSMVLLTVLTASINITICWTPNDVVFTLMLWPPYDQMDQGLVTAVNVLFSLQSVLDPILFVCSLSYLRKAFPRCGTVWKRLRK